MSYNLGCAMFTFSLPGSPTRDAGRRGLPFSGERFRRRRAFSMIEVMFAAVLAFVMSGVYVGMNVYRARQDVGVVSRLAALDEARAAMETLVARPFEELAPLAQPVPIASLPRTSAEAAGQTPSAFRQLPGARLICRLAPYSGTIPGGGGRALEISVQAFWKEDGVERRLELVTVKGDSWMVAQP